MISTLGTDESEKRKAELRHDIYYRKCNKAYSERVYQMVVIAKALQNLFKQNKQEDL
jgi:hypothetical protein